MFPYSSKDSHSILGYASSSMLRKLYLQILFNKIESFFSGACPILCWLPSNSVRLVKVDYRSFSYGVLHLIVKDFRDEVNVPVLGLWLPEIIYSLREILPGDRKVQVVMNGSPTCTPRGGPYA